MASRGDIRKEDVQPTLSNSWNKLGFEQVLDKTGSFVKLKSKGYLTEGAYPVVDQGEAFVSGFVDDEELIYKGNLPVVIFGDHTRNLKFVDFSFAAGADGTKILKPIDALNEKFFYYYLKALKVPSLGYSRHFAILKSLDVPVPPLVEQNRIVAKLDEAFMHLETLKAKLERIPELLKKFRQTVLTYAVTGKLTEEWRKGKGLTEWKQVLLEELASVVDPHPSHRSPAEVPQGIPYVSIKDIQEDGTIDLDKARKVPRSILEEHINRYDLMQGDFIFGKIGTLGKPALLPIFNERNYALSANVILIQPRHVNANYLYYYLSSNIIEKLLLEGTNSTSQPAFGIKKVRSFPVPLPPEAEQLEIERRINALFAETRSIEKRYSLLKGKLNKLPHALLAKAFRGELVKQD